MDFLRARGLLVIKSRARYIAASASGRDGWIEPPPPRRGGRVCASCEGEAQRESEDSPLRPRRLRPIAHFRLRAPHWQREERLARPVAMDMRADLRVDQGGRLAGSN